MLSSKVHLDAFNLGSKARIIDSFISKVEYPILPCTEEHFKAELSCGVQYIRALFVLFGKIFNLSRIDEYKGFWNATYKVVDHKDYKEWIKAMQINK